jgi:ABC-2 type transport system permease protein
VSGKRVAAITKRLLEQFRRDRRTLALLFVAPIVILGLLGYLMRGSSSAPSVGIANEDQGPLGSTVAAALAKSGDIATTEIQASDGDSKLKDGSLTAYIVFAPDFSSQARAGTIAPDVRLEGSQPGTIAPVLQALQQALISVASSAPGQGLHVQPHITYLYGGPGFDTLDYFGAAFIGLVVFFLVFVVTIVSFLN